MHNYFIVLTSIILFGSLNTSSQNLISVHKVQDINEMNQLEPEAGSIIYVEGDSSNYKYDGSSWFKIDGTSTTSLIIEQSTLDSIQTYVSGVNCQDCRPRYEVGDTLDCGVVFFTNPGGRSGLIVAFEDIAEMPFNCPGPVTPQVFSYWNGYENSILIDASCDTSAATVALNYDACGGGWYLPARNELRILHRNILDVNYMLDYYGATPLTTTPNDYYWTSTENSNNVSQAIAINFPDTYIAQNIQYVNASYSLANRLKTDNGRVRPIREFYLYQAPD